MKINGLSTFWSFCARVYYFGSFSFFINPDTELLKILATSGVRSRLRNVEPGERESGTAELKREEYMRRMGRAPRNKLISRRAQHAQCAHRGGHKNWFILCQIST